MTIFLRRFFLTAIISASLCSLLAPPVLARDYAYDWYVKNFESEITLNKDSTMDVVERITADAGDLPDKHGIFRVLPTRARTPSKTYPNPVELISITDFEGKPRKYTVINNPFDGTITSKIGDPDITVHGENFYEIHYRYKNVVRFDNPSFDEFYWNLNGNFWDIETDAFTATINLPEGVTKENTDISYYTGYEGYKSTDQATYSWESPNTLRFVSTGTLTERQGITASLSFPKNIFTPTPLGFFDVYGWILPYFMALLLPLATFILCFAYWFKHGRDSNIQKTHMPEFTIPENLDPMSMMMVKTGGIWKKNFIAAGIVSLATKGVLKINDLKKGIFSAKDYEFVSTGTEKQIAALDPVEKKLYDSILGGGESVKMSSLKVSFSSSRDEIKKMILNTLVEKEIFTKKGLGMQKIFYILAFAFPFIGVFPVAFIISGLGLDESIIGAIVPATFLCSLILVFFGRYMMQRTAKGSEVNWHITNLKKYMETAEKQRAEYYEKENIFEKFLPYAVGFGITGLWIKKMQEIYGDKYYSTHHPGWYGGNMQSFSAGNFTSALNSMSSEIGSSMGTSSGSGGSGGSGGGGGGGGGGGW